jgi:hypothetical protein
LVDVPLGHFVELQERRRSTYTGYRIEKLVSAEDWA